MITKERLSEDVKIAMKSGDKQRLSVLRYLLSQVKQKEVDTRKAVEEKDIIDILSLNIKQRKESIAQFEKGGREDLVKKETEELSIIQGYLPEPLSEDELKSLIDNAILELKASGLKDLGKVMKDIIPKTKGRADSNMVNILVKQRLGS